MSCYPAGGPAWRCPSAEDLAPQVRALLPRGRAWATSDGAFDSSSVLGRYWRAVSDVFAFAYSRLCDLRSEFWCATHTETHAEWMAEYGLPDDCDPFPDLCVKVAAIGGASCTYLTAVAARAGWSISCAGQCAAAAGCAEPGGDPVGSGLPNGTLVIVVHVLSSPAYAAASSEAEAGCLEAGEPINCEPLDALRCLLDRIVQAHIIPEYLIAED